MLVDILSVPGKRKKLLLLKCDGCNVEFTSGYNSTYIEKLHFHSSECSRQARKKGGILQKQIEQTCLDRFGVKNPSQAAKVQEQIRNTNIERYGVPYGLMSDEIQEKRRQTCQKNLGVDWPAQNPSVVKKLLENYEDSEFVQFVNQRKREGMLRNHGVETGFQTQNNRAVVASPEAQQKKHKTRKANGTYATSKPEDRLYESLVNEFGEHDINRGVTFYGLEVDFHIKSIDVCIQSDGYWHGTGRDINEVKEFKTAQDETIYGTMLRDIRQNQAFEKAGRKLIRVTDLAYKGLANVRLSDLEALAYLQVGYSVEEEKGR